MSRSRKKTKIRGVTKAKSEKRNKQNANRKFRRLIKLKVENDEIVLPEKREVSNVWEFDKDGKIYDPEMNKLLRK